MTVPTQQIQAGPESRRYDVRPMRPSDYAHLQRLEREIWAADEIGELCPYYQRLCTDFYSDWCFIAMDGDRPAGYVLNFPNGKVNYCATLAVHPHYQKTRVNYLLIRAMVRKLMEESMEECRFLVEPHNLDARAVHESLGARVVAEVPDYYREGDVRLWSVIDRTDLARLGARYARLKLVS
ncbi:MAG TPA: GNAT family N-acetyltransferase [Holophaga sp.]|nr:GNAT family N-acetyltransferase [Holophaga sp.]